MGRALLAFAFSLAPAYCQPRVVLVDIDGVRRDTFENACLKEKLPNFSRVLGENFSTALWFENATSVFPSVTMTGQASIFTGTQPAQHGILGNQWFDRTTVRLIDYMTSTGTPCVYGILLFSVADCSGGYANRHLQTTTLYEAAAMAGKRSVVVFSQYWKGATRAVLPSVSDAALLVQGGSVNYEKFDSTMMDRAIEALHRDALPDILTVYFAGADGIGHALGTAGQARYLRNTIDIQMGRLLDTLEDLDSDWRKNTLFIITADHGRTDAPPIAADKFLDAEMRNALERARYSADQYRMVEDGGVVQLYLRSRAPGAQWAAPPRPEDVLAVAKELSSDAALGAVMDSMVIRKYGPGSGYEVYGDKRAMTEASFALLTKMDSLRSGDLLLLLKLGHYLGNTASAGAQHGSIHSPDLAVPIVLALGGTKPGRSPVPLSTADIAKIVAAHLSFTIQTKKADTQGFIKMKLTR